MSASERAGGPRPAWPRPASLGAAWAVIADLGRQLDAARADAASRAAQCDRQADELLRQVARIDAQQEQLHRLRAALGHPRPLLAALATDEEEHRA